MKQTLLKINFIISLTYSSDGRTTCARQNDKIVNLFTLNKNYLSAILYIALALIINSSSISSAQSINDKAINDKAINDKAINDKADSALQLIRNQKKAIIIDSLSLNHYAAAFIPAIADSIAEQELVITAQTLAPSEFKPDNSWINSALKGGTRTLSGDTALPNPKDPRNSAFGSFEEIQEEPDLKLRAKKLLWNVESILEANRFIDLKINLSWSKPSSTNLDGINARVVSTYPASLGTGQTISLREKFAVLEPDWLSTLAFLTLRQYGSNEDKLWISSPTLLTSRELAGSLRGDQLFESLFSLDDLQIFSGKPELLEPNLSGSFETLTPFVATNSSGSKITATEAPCTELSNINQENSNPLSSIYFSPRKVFALELKQKDPYSQIGRQKLYIDAATMLPFFKEVYTQDGKLLKAVLGAFTQLNVSVPGTASQQESHFIPYRILAFGKAGEMSVLKTLSAKTCSIIPKDITTKFFDPSELAAPQKSLQTPNKTPNAH